MNRIHPDNEPFPIQGDGLHAPESSIPGWLAERAYAKYVKRYGSRQSMKRLAERGGFGRDELIDLLTPKGGE